MFSFSSQGSIYQYPETNCLVTSNEECISFDVLWQLSSPSELAEAKNVRSLTSAVKNLESKLGPLEVTVPKTVSEKNTETSDSVAQIPVEAES